MYITIFDISKNLPLSTDIFLTENFPRIKKKTKKLLCSPLKSDSMVN